MQDVKCLIEFLTRSSLGSNVTQVTSRLGKASVPALIAEAVQAAKLEAHLVSMSCLYARMLGKKSWFARTEGANQNSPLLSTRGGAQSRIK